MSTEQSTIYRDDNRAEVIGWVSRGGCENPACLAAMRDGREFHATPTGFAVTLPDYHFATADEAEAAIRSVMANVPGRTLALTVGDDHAWRAGKAGA